MPTYWLPKKRGTTFTTDSTDPPWKNTRKELILYLHVHLPNAVSWKDPVVNIQKKRKNKGQKFWFGFFQVFPQIFPYLIEN